MPLTSKDLDLRTAERQRALQLFDMKGDQPVTVQELSKMLQGVSFASWMSWLAALRPSDCACGLLSHSVACPTHGRGFGTRASCLAKEASTQFLGTGFLLQPFWPPCLACKEKYPDEADANRTIMHKKDKQGKEYAACSICVAGEKRQRCNFCQRLTDSVRSRQKLQRCFFWPAAASTVIWVDEPSRRTYNTTQPASPKTNLQTKTNQQKGEAARQNIYEMRKILATYFLRRRQKQTENLELKRNKTKQNLYYLISAHISPVWKKVSIS